MKTAVNLLLDDAPKWMSHIEMTADDENPDLILFRVVKTNGTDYGCASLLRSDLLRMVKSI